MKKITAVLALLLSVQFAFAGLDFIGIDGVQTDYTAGTGQLLMDQDGLKVIIDYDDGSPQGSIDMASFTLSTGYNSGMQFTGGTFSFLDNTNTVIIAGNVLTVDFFSGGSLLMGEGTVQVTQSNLAGYPLGISDIVSLTFSLSPSFTDFQQDYSGLSKVNFLVPEPATLALLGLGGLLLRKRRI